MLPSDLRRNRVIKYILDTSLPMVGILLLVVWMIFSPWLVDAIEEHDKEAWEQRKRSEVAEYARRFKAPISYVTKHGLD
jgi:hypothetical protein